MGQVIPRMKPKTTNSKTVKRSCEFLSFGLALFCLGCSVTRGTRTPDGTLTVSNYRALWTTEAVNFSLAASNLTVTLRIGASATDSESVGAVTEGVVKGLTRP
jgi:hypothetical protein